MPCRLRLLALLLLPFTLAACTFSSVPPRLSPAPASTLTSTPRPFSTIPASFTPTLPPATRTSAPPPSATSTRVVPSSTPAPSPTPSLVPTPTGLPLLRYNPRDLVLALAWSPDGRMLAVAAGESIHLVDAATLAELRVLPVGAWAGSLAFSPDGTRLALAAKDGSLQVWEPATGLQKCRLDAHHPAAKSVAFSPDGRWLASTGNDAYVRLWDVSAIPLEGACSLAPSAEMIGGAFSVPFAVFSPDGTVIASVDFHAIRLREVASQRLVRTLTVDTSIFSLAYSPDGSWLASADLGNAVRVWDVASGAMLRVLSRPGLPSVFVGSVVFSPDGKLLAAGSSDAAVTLWDPAGGQLVRAFTGHTGAVTCVAFSPDGLRLASGSLDATVRVWPVDLP